MQAPPPIPDRELQRLFHASFAHEFRRPVRAYMKRRWMRPSTFSREALNDPGFVKRAVIKRRPVGLTTADQAMAYMKLQTFRPLLVFEIKAFLDITGVKAWQVGEWAIHQSAFIERLYGGASPRLATIDQLRAWMHRQLRPRQLEAVLLAVAKELAVGEEAGGDFFPKRITMSKRRSRDERWGKAVDDEGGRRAGFVEPQNAGTLPRHGRGPPLPQDRALRALHARGPRRLGRCVRAAQYVGPGALSGASVLRHK